MALNTITDLQEAQKMITLSIIQPTYQYDFGEVRIRSDLCGEYSRRKIDEKLRDPLKEAQTIPSL